MVLWLTLSLSACAVTSVDGDRMQPRSDVFSAYVEEVFRRQSEIATELTLALDTEAPDGDRYIALEDAELELLTACRGLNEMAQRRREGDDIRRMGALKRARQAPECERATRNAAALF